MTRVLVTGVNGFVGNHLAKELHQNHIEVVGIGGPRGTTERSPFVDQYIALNLLNRSEVHEISFRGIDGVIHLAGLAALNPSFGDPMSYVQTNIGIEVNLFEEALAQNLRPRFLIVSSGALYNPHVQQPLTEESPVTPSSPYAVSKMGQEQMAFYYSLRGFECIVARPFNHIGPGQGTGFIVPDLAKQVIELKAGKTDHVLVGNLDAQRDYTDVRDIVHAYRLLLEKGRPGQIYNICSGVARSGHEILSLITKAADVAPSLREDPQRMRPSDSPILYGDHRKLSTDTGWQPSINIETTINDVITDWRERLA